MIKFGEEMGTSNVYVALVDSPIETEKELINLLEFAKKTMRPLIIVAQDFSSEALTAMVVNKLQLGINVVGIKAPIFQGSDIIADLNAFTGASILGDMYSDYESIEKADPVHVVGKITHAQISAKQTILRGGQDCTERIQYLENSLDNVLMGDFEKELTEERIGKLKGGLCIVKSGGYSEVEIQECRDRIEDSLFAVRAALEDGYVIGGGLALHQAAQKALKNEMDLGSRILLEACKGPALQIIQNATGSSGHVALEKCHGNYGFNARTKQFENLIEAGIIDPVKVVKNSLEYSAGVASIMLTTDKCIINEDPF